MAFKIFPYTRAATLNPHHEHTLYNLANTLARNLNRFQEALNTVDRLLNTHPNHVNGLYLRGRILIELNRPEQAQECFNRVLELDPKYPHLQPQD